MRRRHPCRGSICLLVFSGVPLAHGATTTTWEMSSYQDFIKGKFTGISLDRDGHLTLSPKLAPLFNSDQAVIWSVAQSPNGSVYAGTGHGGRVFEISPSGENKLIWKADQPEVFTVALNRTGVLYAGTSPDGKVYRIENGKATEFFDPHAKYIWAIAFAPDGSMFVGTGNQGKIYRVETDGKGEVYYETGQSHVTSLAMDAQGRLLAGSEPNGILYRVSAKNKAFALYNSNLPEIRALLQAPDGSLYAAAMGGSVTSRIGMQAPAAMGTIGAAGSTPSVSVTVTDSTSDGSAVQAGPDIKPKPQTLAAGSQMVTQMAGNYSPIVEVPGVEKSAVYRIHPDNTVDTLWSSKDENVYDLTVGTGGDLFLATDVRGRVYRLGPDHKPTLLTQTGEGEATRLLESSDGLLAATGDIGKLFRIGTQPGQNGTYESPVHDAGTVARWGRLSWRTGGGAAKVRFETRTGNAARPDATWSDWSGPISDARNDSIRSPNARYIQWRADLEAPVTIQSVTIAYLPQNTPPVVHSVSVSSVGQSASSAKTAPTPSSPASYSITVTDSGETSAPTIGRQSAGQIQISWQADDADNDKLAYAVYFRGEGEQNWKLLKDNFSDNTYNLDGDSLADGRYFFRVVASDRLSNPPDQAREADLISSPVLIDNTPPIVKIAAARRSGNVAEVDVEAIDAASALRRCEYSIDAGPWTPVEAADGITDSMQEQFLIRQANLSPGEHLVVVRVYDSAGNAGLAKVLLRPSDGS